MKYAGKIERLLIGEKMRHSIKFSDSKRIFRMVLACIDLPLYTFIWLQKPWVRLITLTATNSLSIRKERYDAVFN